MTNELLRRISALRGINPRLNSVTDQVTEIVTTIEKTLVEELKIGIDASQWFLTEFGGEQGTSLEHYLAFNRVGSAGFRIHVAIVTVRDTSGRFRQSGLAGETEGRTILWTSCNREMKLKAFEKLPDLLDSIIAGAESLMQTADRRRPRSSRWSAKTKRKKNRKKQRNRLRAKSPKKPGEMGDRAESLFDPRRRACSSPVSSSTKASPRPPSARFRSTAGKKTAQAAFVSRDAHGKVRCSIVFVDEEGSAEITFPDGECDSVTLEEE